MILGQQILNNYKNNKKKQEEGEEEEVGAGVLIYCSENTQVCVLAPVSGSFCVEALRAPTI